MGMENMESHPKSRFRDIRTLLAPDRSFPSIDTLLPRRLADTPFVRFLNSPDEPGHKDSDIYRDNALNMVFTHERWDNHRSTLRYVKHLAYMFNSNVFKALLGPVCAVMFISLLVGLYETLLAGKVLPAHWPHVTLALGQAFNLTAFALSLLLVFRTNSSYDRWWEARKLWGGVVNRTRDVMRQTLTFYQAEDVHLKELVARWTMALPYVLMVHLRSGMDLQNELKNILQPEEIAAMQAVQHRPNFVLQVLAEINRSARMEWYARMRMDENLTFFEDAMGSMERILRTPIPLSYTRHTSRFLLIWLMMLPFTMWAAYSWSTVLLSAIFAFLMLGIDEIGVQIEEPFGVLPIEAYCQTIERNIRELLSRNYDVSQLVLRQNYPIGGTAALLEPSNLPATMDGSSFGTSSGSGEEFEFGEMTGAAPRTSAAGSGTADAGISKQGALTHVITLTATSAGGGGSVGTALPPRRVRFAEQAVVSPVAAAAQPRDMIEIELGQSSNSTSLAGQPAGPRSSYASTWLQH